MGLIAKRLEHIPNSDPPLFTCDNGNPKSGRHGPLMPTNRYVLNGLMQSYRVVQTSSFGDKPVPLNVRSVPLGIRRCSTMFGD
jgi:hypothetical protein